MKSIIMMEGIDDIYFIGYYLYKKSDKEIKRINKESLQFLSKMYSLSCLAKEEKISYYEYGDHKLALCAVGGKNKLLSSLSNRALSKTL